MGISRLTAYTIATRDDIEVDSGGPAANGKYAGFITLGQADRYRILLESIPSYDTPEAAKAAMLKSVAEIREFAKKEMAGRDPITAVMEMAPDAPASSVPDSQ
jgi:hypothetical protein